MATFVLVHGAWHGGWCYDRVAERLRAAGFAVFAPTLSGLGERASDPTRDIDLETHVEDVVELLRREDLHDVILCGHSYGGAVVEVAADREPARISGLVFLDAFIPRDGQSLFSQTDPERVAALRKNLDPDRPWMVKPIPAAAFHIQGDDALLVDSKCTPHPLRCFEQEVVLSGASATVTNRTYVLAEGRKPSPFPAIAQRLREDPSWSVLSLPGSHDLMLDRPADVASILIASAERSP